MADSRPELSHTPEQEKPPSFTAQEFHIAVQAKAFSFHGTARVMQFRINSALTDFVGIDRGNVRAGATDETRAKNYKAHPEKATAHKTVIQNLVLKHQEALGLHLRDEIDPSRVKSLSDDELLAVARQNYDAIQELAWSDYLQDDKKLQELLSEKNYAEAYGMLMDFLEGINDEPIPEHFKNDAQEECLALINCLTGRGKALGVEHVLAGSEALGDFVRSVGATEFTASAEADAKDDWGFALVEGIGALPADLDANGKVRFGFHRENVSHRSVIPKVIIEGNKVEKVRGRDILGEPNLADIDTRWQGFLQFLGASGHQTVFTHKTSPFLLPDIIHDQKIGAALGERGHFHPDFEEAWGITKDTLGIFVEEFSVNRTEGMYTNGHEPVFIFSQAASEKMRPTGRDRVYIHKFPVIVNGVSFTDPDLLHVWIPTPTFRENLLKWINTWPEEKRRDTFGSRNIDELFVSQV